MSIFQAAVLALVQGISEFLPVSSSAHLIFIPALLGWPDQGLAFDVVVHLGTLTAVITYFRRDLGAICYHWFSQIRTGHADPQGFARLGNLLILATIPTGIAGLLGKDFVETHLRSPLVIAAATLFFGILLGIADYCRGKKHLSSLRPKEALLFGAAQALALIPGTSRSGITLTAGLFLGYTREDAARFSFLMSVPIIMLSGILAAKDLLSHADTVAWGALGVGFALSAASAYLCIALFMKALRKIGMMPYVIYRIILAIVLVVLTLNGVFRADSVQAQNSLHGRTVIVVPLYPSSMQGVHNE